MHFDLHQKKRSPMEEKKKRKNLLKDINRTTCHILPFFNIAELEYLVREYPINWRTLRWLGSWASTHQFHLNFFFLNLSSDFFLFLFTSDFDIFSSNLIQKKTKKKKTIPKNILMNQNQIQKKVWANLFFPWRNDNILVFYSY